MTSTYQHSFPILLCALALLGTGCVDGPPAWEPAEQEFSDFQRLYPTLIRDCGFHTCHGSEERAFRLVGPGRARLDPETLAFDPPTGDEWSAAFLLTRAMINKQQPARSLLLRKPLAVAAGGAPHGGVDAFGRDVYRTVNDEGYLAIARFVLTLEADKDEDE